MPNTTPRRRLITVTAAVAVLTALVTALITDVIVRGRDTTTGVSPGGLVASTVVQPGSTSPPVSPVPSRSPSPSPPHRSPTHAPTTNPATTSPATRHPPAGSARVPADVLNLTNWKLTLPIGSSNKPQEILQPTLATYTITPYFMVNPAGTGVIFQANAGGVTTSNSGYPRSELREMANGGADEASWSTTSGTNTMVVRAAITHLTVAKPQVTVAQIHDNEDDVLVIRLDGPHHLYAEHNGTDYGDLDTGYTLGTAFTATMVASGGHIKIYYNGALKADYVKASSGDYFKAGCYTQSNTSKGDAADAYAQVVIYALQVTHSS